MDLRKFRDLVAREELYFRRADLFSDEREGVIAVVGTSCVREYILQRFGSSIQRLSFAKSGRRTNLLSRRMPEGCPWPLAKPVCLNCRRHLATASPRSLVG